MATLVKCPLSDADCKKLDQLLQSCSDTRCILESLTKLGAQVQPLIDDNESQHAFASGVKAEFFPGKP